MLISNKNFLDEKSKYIINNLEGKLREDDIKYFIETYIVGEAGIAYEDLCTQINEFDIKISKKVFDALKDMCIYYEIDPKYWNRLKNLVID